jgi:hypothetical protein
MRTRSDNEDERQVKQEPPLGGFFVWWWLGFLYLAMN